MVTHSSILAQRIPVDRGAWWAAVHGVTKGGTELSAAHMCILNQTANLQRTRIKLLLNL